MSVKLNTLIASLQAIFADRVSVVLTAQGEVTLYCLAVSAYLDVAQTLRDHPDLAFAQLTDLSGLDISEYPGYASAMPIAAGKRFAVVSHLLSVQHNWRLRLCVLADDNDAPMLPSLVSIWNDANWYEREVYDMHGVRFEGHGDLRRILTDYGFTGHPLRKDFPVSGQVEMRYDAEKQRVVYQPVSIDPRVVTPRIVREPGFAGSSPALARPIAVQEANRG